MNNEEVIVDNAYIMLLDEIEELKRENKELKDQLLKCRQSVDKKKIFGEYKHVRLSNKEYKTLVDTYGDETTKELITYLDEYIEMKGYKAKNHYLCIRKWVVEAVNQNKEKTKNKVPEWYGKEVQQYMVEDINKTKEMEELLKDFN